MALFCLVHGSTQGPAGWDLLVAELQKLGHDTVRPDLSTGEPEASDGSLRGCNRGQLAFKTRQLMYSHQAMVEVCPLEHWPAVPASYIVRADDGTSRMVPASCARAVGGGSD
jgi:hypothetical protein